jgi:hypothetical protein
MQDIRVPEYQEKDARVLRPDILMPWYPDPLFFDCNGGAWDERV